MKTYFLRALWLALFSLPGTVSALECPPEIAALARAILHQQAVAYPQLAPDGQEVLFNAPWSTESVEALAALQAQASAPLHRLVRLPKPGQWLGIHREAEGSKLYHLAGSGKPRTLHSALPIVRLDVDPTCEWIAAAFEGSQFAMASFPEAFDSGQISWLGLQPIVTNLAKGARLIPIPHTVHFVGFAPLYEDEDDTTLRVIAVSNAIIYTFAWNTLSEKLVKQTKMVNMQTPVAAVTAHDGNRYLSIWAGAKASAPVFLMHSTLQAGVRSDYSRFPMSKKDFK